MRARLALLLAFALFGAGCGTRACKAGTLLVSLTLDAAGGAADQLQVRVTVAGGVTVATTVPHAPGALSGAIEIDFAPYPAGAQVTVTVDALAAGAVVASRAGAVTLDPGCGTLAIAFGADGGSCVPVACPAGACGLVPDGCLGTLTCAPCQLNAIYPSVAAAGDLVSLEGRFSAPLTVNFPGGVTAPATASGAGHAMVAVPTGAGEGTLTVTTGGETTRALPFRRAGFQLGLGASSQYFPQADYARAMPMLARSGYAATLTPRWLLVAGGTGDGQTPTASLVRLTVNDDGTLGAADALAAPALATPRMHHAAVSVGDRIYELGGEGPAGVLDSVEVTIAQGDGSFAPFAAGPALTRPRTRHAAVVVGGWVYVVGGSGDGVTALASVERAPVDADGGLGAFADAGVQLAIARRDFSLTVAGGQVYVAGGYGAGGAALASVERAPIGPDGALGPFQGAGAALPAARATHAGFAIGATLYLAGGDALDPTITSAPIFADGTLGAFTAQAPYFAHGRGAMSCLVIENNLYCLGGGSAGLVEPTVERAPIDASGGLGAFSAVGASPPQPRTRAALAVSGGCVYLIGGQVAGADTASVLCGAKKSDGTLAWSDAGVHLATARAGGAAAVVGDALYVVGGDVADLDFTSVERAPLAADGTLGQFAAATGALQLDHATPIVFATGAFLYVGGGVDGTGAPRPFEAAPISAAGALGPFAATARAPLAAHGGAVTALIGATFHIAGDGAAGANGEIAAIDPSGALGAFTLTASAGPNRLTAGAAIGPYLYIIGGTDGTSELDALTRCALAADGSFGACDGSAPSLLRARQGHAGVVLGDWLYLVGGQSGAGLVTTDRAPLQ